MSIEQITMPKLGESVTEGTISRWLVSVGDKVNKYDPLAEVMTDKVNAEIPSSYAGVIRDLIAGEGDTLEVGAVICAIEVEASGSAPDDEQALTSVPQPTESSGAIASSSSAKNRFSPAVLKLSGEHGIDLSLVKGTGAGGRITRKDLLQIIESGQLPTTPVTTTPVRHVEAKREDEIPRKNQSIKDEVETSVGDREIPVTSIRKAIAHNMLRSKHEIPHAWVMVEVDVTNLVAYRHSLKDSFKSNEGFNLTYFAFFVKACAQALKEFPQMNSMWAGEKIIQKKDIHLSIAVSTEDALYVPVIKNADEKTIKGLARDIHELAHKVRAGKLTSTDMQGGTFTINNTGSFGSVQSMGIINYPQAAILQVESIVKRPIVVDGGMIAVRDMVNLCLSIDHRVLDGLIAGKFLQRLKQILEQTSASTTNIY